MVGLRNNPIAPMKPAYAKASAFADATAAALCAMAVKTADKSARQADRWGQCRWRAVSRSGGALRATRPTNPPDSCPGEAPVGRGALTPPDSCPHGAMCAAQGNAYSLRYPAERPRERQAKGPARSCDDVAGGSARCARLHGAFELAEGRRPARHERGYVPATRARRLRLAVQGSVAEDFLTEFGGDGCNFPCRMVIDLGRICDILRPIHLNKKKGNRR